MSDFRDFIRKVSTSPEELARRELIENASKLSDSIKDHISSEAKSGRFEKIGNRCRIKGYAAICRFDSDSYFGLVYGNLADVCKYTTDFVGSELDRSRIDWYWKVCGVKTITDSTLFHGWTKEFYITEEENAICDIAKRTLSSDEISFRRFFIFVKDEGLHTKRSIKRSEATSITVQGEWSDTHVYEVYEYEFWY